ncbi:hypothetical protein JCM6882_003325 [Rhodosporidiobolus microsporus]
MALARLRPALHALPSPCSCYHSQSSSSSSPFASTSAATLDDPATPWDALVQRPLSRARFTRRNTGSDKGRGKGKGKGKQRTRETGAVPVVARETLPRLVRRTSGTRAPAQAQADTAAKERARVPPSDRTQISPFLPLVTRERNHLLSAFRQALYSRSSPSSPSPPSSAASWPTRRRTVRTKAQAWDPDAVWVSLARVLRYPDELPELPHSYFPSSTRAPAGFYDEADPSSSSPSSPFTASDAGFFSSAHPSPSPSSPSLPPPHPLNPPPHSLRPDGRHHPLSPSLAELKRAFTVLSSARPRTRTGLERLLVVAELIARAKGAGVGLDGGVEGEGGVGGGSGGDGKVERLRGGGAGLSEKDWAQLLLFAGASLRTTRPEPEMQSVLALFGQYLERAREAREGRERRLTNKQKKALAFSPPLSSFASSPAPHTAPPPHRSAALTLYTALLHLAARARMYDLYDQIRARMRAESLLATSTFTGAGGGGSGGDVNVATAVVQLGKDARAGAGVEALWSVFEEAVAAAAKGRAGAGEGEGAGGGEEHARAAASPLWAAMAWWLAHRGHLDDARRVYDAMRAGGVVDLHDLRPSAMRDDRAAAVDESMPLPPLPPLPPPLWVRPPPPNEGVATALVQACCFHGDFEGAASVLRDVLSASSGSGSGVEPSSALFHPLFRIFARYGVVVSDTGGGGGGGRGGAALSGTRLRGEHVSAYAASSRSSFSSPSSSPLAALSSALSSARADTDTRSPSASASTASTNPLTLPALTSLLTMFLSLPPPPSSAHPSLPFRGSRTAPSSKELFWILFAFERLSGGDSKVVVEVWGLLVGRFAPGGGGEGGGWTGWRVDRRVRDMVKKHVGRLEEAQRRWEEVQ